MAWDQLSINKPHLVYLILGGFTSLFMLCSSVIKERLYIGEATVATLCGIIFGPHAAGLIDPSTWGNADQITLEFSRIVLVVQCFAVGAELPRAYMEKHWRSVLFLLVPVMTFGWLITSLFIYGLVPSLNWLDSLVVAACVTATDPVLAASVVGKGKFAKRVPKHLRDLLSAESGCNDGMAFPFVYLGLYLIKYRPDSSQVAYHWICYTILYECLLGAIYGFFIGYAARRAIRFAHEKHYIDRESFLVFYFVLALFCAGSGSLLGLDDLLVGFACGIGFSNDGWFTSETEESHVSNVIDLLLNLAFFVYFGTIIPWEQFNAEQILGLTAWRLVVVAILVLLFRRLPIMLILKPVIPDLKTWREASFAGHFGPIGVGAIFVALLARAELETETTTPLAQLPEEGFPHLNVIELIWPITCFLVICSIVVHGSSIAVFTLGKHINTLTLTMSYTQGDDPSWMNRLPKIQSRSRTSMSKGRESFNEKLDVKPGELPKDFLRRQKMHDDGDEDEDDLAVRCRRPGHRRKRSKYGGPISESAIAPRRSPSPEAGHSRRSSETEDDKNETVNTNDRERRGSSNSESHKPRGRRGSSNSGNRKTEERGEIYEEGGKTVYEDAEGNVLEVEDEEEGASAGERHRHEMQEAGMLMATKSQEDERRRRHEQRGGGEADEEERPTEHASEKHQEQDNSIPLTPQERAPRPGWKRGLSRGLSYINRDSDVKGSPKSEDYTSRRGPARAYQYGNTIIVEDEAGEVIKKYDISLPSSQRGDGPSTSFTDPLKTRQRMHKMGSYLGVRTRDTPDKVVVTGDQNEGERKKKKSNGDGDDNDDNIRFTFESGGKRMGKAEFIEQIQRMDPKSRARFVEQSNVPEAVKEVVRADAREHVSNAVKARQSQKTSGKGNDNVVTAMSSKSKKTDDYDDVAEVKRYPSNTSAKRGSEGLSLTTSRNETVPLYNASEELQNRSAQSATNSPAHRRNIGRSPRVEEEEEEDSEDDGTERIPPTRTTSNNRPLNIIDTEEETAAERRRREDALGIIPRDSESEDDVDDQDLNKNNSQPRDNYMDSQRLGHERTASADDRPSTSRPGIRFADEPTTQRGNDATKPKKTFRRRKS